MKTCSEAYLNFLSLSATATRMIDATIYSSEFFSIGRIFDATKD